MTLASDIAERAAGVAGSGALVRIVRERSIVLRFALSRPTQSTAVDDVTVEVAALHRGHVGRATTNRLDDDALAACAQRARAAAVAAEAAAGEGAYPGFPLPRPGRTHDGHDADTAALDPAPGGDALAAAFAAAEPHGLEAHGVWSAAEVETAIATRGEVATDTVTDAFMKVVCIDPRTGRSGYASASGSAIGALDPAATAARAAAKAAASGEPAQLPPGEYPVVMEPDGVGIMLDQLAWTAFNGLAHVEERGALVDRLGTQVAVPSINLSDSPRSSVGLPRAIDAEAVPKAPLPLIQDGVAHRVTHDTRSAALAGTESTGHALAPGGAPDGCAPTNLVLAGGGAADVEELCAPIERGVYVTRLWYANVLRPKETLMTAVTRDGTFLIEDGQITRPAGDLRLTDSILGALSRVQTLTGAQTLANEGEFYGRRFAYGVVCPALRFASLRFTDTAG